MLSNGWGHIFRKLAVEKFHLDNHEMDLRHKLMFVPFEEGKVTLHEYLDRVVFYQKRDFSREEFRDFMFSLNTAETEMINLVKKLRVQYNLKIVAVNNEERELNVYRINTFQLTSFIDFFISSCYVKTRKPDAAIFEMALDISHVSADEVIYIDDTELFTEIATGFGIRSIRHIDTVSTTKELAALGLELKQVTETDE